MKIIGVFVLLAFVYTSFFFWLKYPYLLDKVFRVKDKRLNKVLSKIWLINFNSRAFVIDKLMKKKGNQSFIEKNDAELLYKYQTWRRYWLWSLVPLGVLFIYSQINLGYEMLFHGEEFREKINNAWFTDLFN